MSTSIVFCIQLPPPIYGAALRNQEFLAYAREHEANLSVVDIGVAREVRKVGSLSFGSICRALKIVLRSCAAVISGNAEVLYITPSSGALAQLKEIPVLIIAKLRGTPVVAHFRNLGFSNNVTTKLMRWTLRDAKCIVMSPRVLHNLSKIVNERDTLVIPNALAAPVIPTRNRTDFRVLNLIYLSNWIPSKGIVEAIHAARYAGRKLLKNGIRVRLCLVGDTADEQFKRRVRAEIDASKNDGVLVDYKGYVYGDEKWRLLAEADALVFPTYYPKELFPGVVLEGMASGCAICASDFAAIPDILDGGRAGLLHPVGDVVTLGEQIASLCTQRGLLVGMQDAAARRYRDVYSPQHVYPRLLSALRQAKRQLHANKVLQ